MTSNPDAAGRSQPAMPHDLAAERSVLGTMLLHGETVPAMVSMLRSEHFYLPRHALIFTATAATHAALRACDPILVAAELTRRGRADEAGGPDALFDLVEGVLPAAAIEHHATLVLDAARRRQLIEVAHDAARRAFEGEDAVDLVRCAEQRFREIVECGPAGTLLSQRMRPWAEVANDPPVAWLVDGIIPAAGSIVLAGEPGSGKTLLELDRALRQSCGMDWLGRKCRPGSTIYFAGEGGHGLATRLRAWRAAHPHAQPVDGHYVAVVDGVPNLTRTSAVREFDDLIAAAAARYGRKPDVATIDTFAMATPGIEENDSASVGTALASLAEVRRRHGCATSLLHHLRKPTVDRPNSGQHAVRGSSAIVGAADVVLIAAAAGEAHALRLVKVRDGQLLPAIAYEIRGQNTGHALDDGRAESGPVVMNGVAAADRASDDPLERDIMRLVDAMEALGGSAKTKAMVYATAHMKPARGVVCFDLAEGRGWFRNAGTATRPDWRTTPVCPRSLLRGRERGNDVPGAEGTPGNARERGNENRRDSA